MPADDDTPIPASFIAAHTEPGMRRPGLSRDALAERHEFCEDLASALRDGALTAVSVHGIAPDEVVARVVAALTGASADAATSAAEAQWVAIRLAESCGWAALAEALQQRWNLRAGDMCRGAGRSRPP